MLIVVKVNNLVEIGQIEGICYNKLNCEVIDP